MNSFFAKYLLFLPGQTLRGEYILKYIRQFERNERMDSKTLEVIQWRKLIRLINYATQYSPYYVKLFKKFNIDPKSINNKIDLLRIPELTKENLRLNQGEMISSNNRNRFSQKITGGSTGEAVTILKDRKAMAYQDAAMWRSLRWYGIDIGDEQARFWGIPIDPLNRKKYKFIDFIMNRIRLSAFNFDDASMNAFLEKIYHFRPKYFYGYASMIKEFAQFCEQKNIDVANLNLKAVVTTSEPLYFETRQYLQKIFKCQIVNDYGCGEVGPIAYECPEGGFHLMSDNLFIEIINERGSHASPGEKGEIVVTELNNHSLPLIRYNLKDIAEVTDKECTCGRILPIINNVTGRVLDVLITSNGEKVHGEYFNYIAEEIKKRGISLKQYQVVQKKINDIIVKIVKDTDYSEETQTYFVHKIKERMGRDINVQVEFVDKIEREKSGKLRLVKCDILK